jgi:hypothetical protein
MAGRRGRNRGGGNKFSQASSNGHTFADIDDEPKFIELPDDFETESGEEKKAIRFANYKVIFIYSTFIY